MNGQPLRKPNKSKSKEQQVQVYPALSKTGSGYDLRSPSDSKIAVKVLRFYLSVFLLLVSLNVFSQENFAFKGYLKYLNMYYHPEIEMPGFDTDHLGMSLLHNRLNFKWFASEKITGTLEIRNRLFFGQIVKKFPDYKSLIDIDNGYLNLSTVIFTSNAMFLHSAIDRLYFEYSSGKWQASIGRQRINWGINLVWNPNDIFNTFSYFDFDYEERPGTDAIKIQYYSGTTSSAELVYKIGKDANHMALAGMYRFSKWDYDFQFLGGWVGTDYVLGGGWAGDIKGGGFRGEATWFNPRQKENGSKEALVASVSGDYTFKNSLYLHTGFLFNSIGTTGNAGGRSFFDQDLSAKSLSLAKYSVFAQASLPFTPLFSGSLSGMLNPSDGSSYVGPSITYSLGNNLELMATGQLFFGESGTEFGGMGQAVYARLKWAF